MRFFSLEHESLELHECRAGYFIRQRDYTDYTVLLCRKRNMCHLFNLVDFLLST